MLTVTCLPVLSSLKSPKTDFTPCHNHWFFSLILRCFAFGLCVKSVGSCCFRWSPRCYLVQGSWLVVVSWVTVPELGFPAWNIYLATVVMSGSGEVTDHQVCFGWLWSELTVFWRNQPLVSPSPLDICTLIPVQGLLRRLPVNFPRSLDSWTVAWWLAPEHL